MTLPTSTPAAQGVDAAGVLAFLDDMAAARGVELHSLMVLRHGHVVAQGWWSPYEPARHHLLYSLSKTFTAAAAGLAVAEGLLDLDEPVVSYFPELDAQVTDAGSRGMLVRHLAAMASGHTRETWPEVAAADPADPVGAFLRLPPDREPGTVFAYNQPATYTLGAIVQRRSGQRLVDYLRPRLLDPLGIGEVAWSQHPSGPDLGFTGLHATTDAVARLGQLLLQGGRWGDRQLLPREWVAEATRAHVATPDRDQVDWRQGYGFQLWMSRHGYRGDGAYGQLCLVLPEQDAVVAVTGQSPDMQRILDGVWAHLLPAFGTGPTSGVADSALHQRLDDLALPPLQVASSRPADSGTWDGTSFVPAGGRCAEQPALDRVTVTADGDRWLLTLGERGGELRVPFGGDGWLTSDGEGPAPVPTAASGGWVDARTLHLAVALLETPHRLELTCRLEHGTFEARWVAAPLGGTLLRDLRSPRPEEPR